MFEDIQIGSAYNVLNNSARNALAGGFFNAHALRPYFDPERGESRVALSANRSMKVNTPAPLQYLEWLDIDRKVVKVATERLVGISDLMSRGLTHNLGTIGVTVSLWDKSSDMTPANVNMSGVTPGEEDTPNFDQDQVPVPIIHKDFRLNLRRLEASRRMGESLDTMAAGIASRLVSEKSEDLLFSGSSIKVEGGTIYGYLNHPNRNTVDLTTGWADTGATGQTIVADVLAMLAAARADLMFGPFVLYIPGEYETILDDDYKAGANAGDTRTIRERILQLNGIEDIKVADRLADDNVILVQMTDDVVDLAMAQDITTVQWNTQGGMQEHFKVMAVWVPRVKSDYDGRSGVVHLRAP